MKCKVIVLMMLLAVLVVTQGCVHSDPWTRTNTIGQVLVTGAIVADMYTTNQIQYHNDVIERNPITVRFLGREPSTRDVVLWGTTVSLSYWAISHALPAKWRPYWQGVTGGAHLWAAHQNSINLSRDQVFCGEQLCPQ